MNNYVLITGSTGGIGKSLAKVFAENKYPLVLTGTNHNKLKELKIELSSKYNVPIEIIEKDLREKNAPKEIYDSLKEKNIIIEILCNNAGFGDYGNFYELDIDKNIDMVKVNIEALMKLTHYFLKDMIKNNKGKILNTCSTAAFQPGPLMATYYASKAFVLSFTESLAKELDKTNITLTALCPGPTKTEFFNRAGSNQRNSKLLKNFKMSNPDKLALYGYKKLMKKRVVAVYGIKNNILIFLERFMPRKTIRNITYQLQKKK